MTRSPIDRAFVEIVPELKNFERQLIRGVRDALKSLQRRVKQATDQIQLDFAESAREAGTSMKRGTTTAGRSVKEFADKATKDLDRVDKKTKDVFQSIRDASVGFKTLSLGGLAGAIQPLITALAAVGTSLISIGSVVAASAVPALATLAATFGVFKVATIGVGDALKKTGETADEFNKAIKGLAPSAQDFVRSIRTATEVLRPLQQSIQQTFFVGTGTAIRNLVDGVRQLGSESRALTVQLNAGFLALLQFSGSLPGLSAVRVALEEARDALAGIVPAIQPVLAGFAALVRQAEGFGTQVGQAIGGALASFGTFLGGVDLNALIATARPVLESLRNIFSDIGNIAGSVFDAFGQSGTGALAIISTLTGTLADFLATAEGSAALQGLANILSTLSAATGAVLVPALKILGKLFVVLAAPLAKIVDALAPVIDALGTALLEVIVALVPSLDYMALLIVALAPALVALVQAITPILIPLLKLLSGLTRLVTTFVVVPLIRELSKALGLLVGPAEAVGKFLEGLGSAIANIDWGAIGSAIADAFTTALNAVTGFFGAVGGFFKRLPNQIGSFLIALPGLLVGLFSQAFHAVLFAIGFGIGLIVKAIIVLPVLIVRALIALPGILANLFTTAFNAVRTAISVGINAVRTFFINMFNTSVSLARSLVTQVISIFTTFPGKVKTSIKALPGAILDVLRSIVNSAFQIGRDIVSGLANGIKSAVGAAVSQAKKAAGSIVSGFKSALGISSPSKVFADEVGKEIPAGIGVGIERGIPNLGSLLNSLPDSLGGGTTNNMPINVQIRFDGAVTEDQARLAGQAAGQGIAATLAKRNVRTQVRTV
ncbi:MAG: phage tail protein [Acidobacteriota bacterium]